MKYIERKASMMAKAMNSNQTYSVEEAAEMSGCEDLVNHASEEAGVVIIADDNDTVKIEKKGDKWRI